MARYLYQGKRRERQPSFTIDDFMWHNDVEIEHEWHYDKGEETFDLDSELCKLRAIEKSVAIMDDLYSRHINGND